MKVYVVGDCYHEYGQMFVDNGWGITTTMEDADLVQFCGGEDVSPLMYDEEPHHTTHSNLRRDQHEEIIFETCLEHSYPITGICRGAQFVHVMCGGKLWQNVDKHGLMQGHVAYSAINYLNPHVLVSSTHHQMMREGVGKVLMIAHLSTFKETMGDAEQEEELRVDVEVMYHKDKNALCFQPHPEFFDKDHPCQQLYFNMIEEYLFNE